MTNLMMTDLASYSSSLCILFVLSLDPEFFGGVRGGSANPEVDSHVQLGVELMARGQFVDALSHFHVAIDGDPDNYLTYYRRATVYLALGKSKMALADLEVVTILKPDFISAWIQRGNILFKQGRLDEAHINFENVLRRDPTNRESLEQYNNIETTRRTMQTAQMLMEDREYSEALHHLTHAIESCPWDPILRELRADCHIANGDAMGAVMDLKAVTKLRGDSTQAHLRLSLLHYELGEADESLNEIRECLKLDPDNKECFKHYKKVKKLAAVLRIAHELLGAEKYTECIEKANTINKVESDVEAYRLAAKSVLCHCHSKSGSTLDAIKICTDALSISENVELLCSRAEAHINNDDFDEALSDFQRGHNIDESVVCAREGIVRAQKLQKQAKRRDYYKILDVARTATKKEIVRAYRKLAQKWHPDSFDGDEKKMAEKKFIDIASAKEVLTDPEKRKKFDSGEDPLDPESNAGQGFNPFGQGFHPFNGRGPFQFKFHFN